MKCSKKGVSNDYFYIRDDDVYVTEWFDRNKNKLVYSVHIKYNDTWLGNCDEEEFKRWKKVVIGD